MIPINLIRQFHFCPRIVYFNLLTNIKPVYPRHVSLGNDYHKKQNELTNNRKFKKLNINYKEVITEKYLEDEELGINGIVDLAFICANEIIPVEFKFIENKPDFSHLLQVVGYGLLLEKYYKLSFRRGYIIHSNNIKFYPIKTDNKIIRDFFMTIEKINGIIENGFLPDSSANENKCSQCEYLNYCDDRF